MEKNSIITIILSLILIILFLSYMFVPFGEISFRGNSNFNSNFSLDNSSSMQFYNNMRFPTNNLSYKISEDCTIKKISDVEEAFQILENKTILNFYSVQNKEDISIFCSEKFKPSTDNLFIAGEGGPTEVLAGKYFNVINHGEILLIQSSVCENPNVALHEILHVLGFNHSNNPNNLMYSVSKCKQTMGEEIPTEINRLYSFEPLADLEIISAEAIFKGRYLDINISIKNEGLVNSNLSNVIIFADNKEIHNFELGNLNVGEGSKISLTNIWLPQLNIKELKIKVLSNSIEFSKENNEIILD